MRRRSLPAALAAGTALVTVLALAPAPAGAVQAPPTAGAADPVATVDVRPTGVLPSAAARDATTRLLAGAQATGTRARASWDGRFGTLRSLTAAQGYLTAPRSGAARDVARAWLGSAPEAFGLATADVAALAVVRDHALPGTGTRVVTFQQVAGGVATAQGGRLTVAVTRDGKVLSYAGNPAPGGALRGAFTLSPAQALGKVAALVAAGTAFTPQAAGRVQAGWEVFEGGPFAGPHYVRQAAFPTKDGPVAAYRVLFVQRLDAAYESVVDAATGRQLYRRSLVDQEAEGTVYDNFPGAPRGGTPVIRSFGPTAESPSGYVDPTGVAGLPGPTTFGNNANTYANYSNFLVPADQAPRPVSPTAQFNYSYAQNWVRSKGQAVPPSYASDLDPAATNLFWHHNRIHDEFYRLGFTESAGNFQTDGGDPILGLVHAGAVSGGAPTYTGRDNAYMLTLPDGIPSWSGMFLWEPINDAFEGPYADGNFDASVIEHEYTHGLTSRYVAGGEALGSQQARSMGEGWGDWYALNYLFREGLSDKAVVGEYVTGNGSRGIRNWSRDATPVGFGDIGYDITGPQVHADGEIWSAMLWDLRTALVARYGNAQGSEVAARLVTDAMPLSAPDPSFLDMRDAILAADVDRYHGDNFDAIWNAFARRGAGASATSKGGDDVDPTPGFDSLNPASNGTLLGRVVNAATGEPVAGARVILGEYEARVTPVRVTSDQGGFGVRAVAGTYSVTVQAPGFGAQTFRGVTVTAGQATRLRLRLQPNLASKANGAAVVSVSSEDAAQPAVNLIDDTEASVWSTKPASKPYNDGPDQRVVVKLAKPARIAQIQVSAYKSTTASRFAAMKDFTFQVSDDGVVWRTVQTGGFTYEKPRPVAPDLHYKTFTLATPVTAGYVRFFVDSVQGETLRYAQAAELQVFADRVRGVEPLPVGPEEPVTDGGTIAVGNPTTGDPTGVQNVFGVTGTDFTRNCGTVPPATQGADGWVTALPASFGDGTHTVTMAPAPGAGPLTDLDLYFLDANCQLLGAQATSGAGESAALPGGTRYVLTQLWMGVQVPFTLTARGPG
ncbi:MAG: M36 family metallopeptidase [Actinomycetota bacterium]